MIEFFMAMQPPTGRGCTPRENQGVGRGPSAQTAWSRLCAKCWRTSSARTLICSGTVLRRWGWIQTGDGR